MEKTSGGELEEALKGIISFEGGLGLLLGLA